MGVLFVILFLVIAGFGVFRSVRFTANRRPEFSLLGVPYFVGAFLVLILYLSFTTVEAGTVGVVKRFGQPTRQLGAGAHLILPFAESVTPVSIQTRVVKPSENASSSDLQIVHVEVTFAYHVDSRYATDILVGLNDDAETRAITPAILESIKAETSQYEAQQLVTQRAKVRDGIEDRVKTKLIPYHIIAEMVSITDFSFSPEYEASIESKQVAEQNAEKATNDLKRIEIQAQQQIAQAKGEAEALRAQKEQITPELLELRTIEMMRDKWNGKLPDVIVGGNSALPMMDVLAAASRKR